MWEYKREEGFSVIPEGAYRIRIKNAEKAQASTGKDMIKFTFEVSGKAGFLFYNLVFLPDRPEITNRNLTQIFDSFKDIPDGDLNLQHWIGKVGACVVKHEEYNGDTTARINYFIRADRQADLPAWSEPKNKDSSDNTHEEGFVDISEELPF